MSRRRRQSGRPGITLLILVFARGDDRRAAFLEAMFEQDDRTPRTIAAAARSAKIARSTGCLWWKSFRTTLSESCRRQHIDPRDYLGKGAA